jgi:hypothetical protein
VHTLSPRVKCNSLCFKVAFACQFGHQNAYKHCKNPALQAYPNFSNSRSNFKRGHEGPLPPPGHAGFTVAQHCGRNTLSIASDPCTPFCHIYPFSYRCGALLVKSVASYPLDRASLAGFRQQHLSSKSASISRSLATVLVSRHGYCAATSAVKMAHFYARRLAVL